MSRDLQWHGPRGVDARRWWQSVTSAAKRGSSNWFARQGVLIVAAYFAYFLVRGFTEGGVAQATANAGRVADLERSLGFFWEPSWQATIAGSDVLVRLANAVYMYGHWPVIIVVAIWLALHRPSRYLLTRNAFLISGAIGLVFFVIFPTAPPRLVGNMEMVDTVTVHSNAYRLLQPPALTNQYAAVPSLHLGWNMLIGMALVLEASKFFVKAVGILLPLAMFAAIVVTGNHFILDAVAGIAVALIGLGIAILISRRGGREPVPEGAPAS